MIFKKITNATPQVQEVVGKLQDKFTLQDMSMIPVGKLFKLGVISDEITKLARQKLAAGQDVDLQELVDIIAQHLGDEVKDIDFAHFGLSDIERLANVLGISERNREKILKRFMGA